jgi:hypothetical protein
MRFQTRRDYVGAYGFLIQSFDQRARTAGVFTLSEPRARARAMDLQVEE